MASLLDGVREAARVVAKGDPVATGAAALAAVLLAFFLIRSVRCALGVAWRFVRPAPDLTKFGKWAVVTGATDGIGLAAAAAFAKRGLNVLLVSRSEQKLQQAAQQVAAANPKVEVRVLAADFTAADDVGLYAKIRAEVQRIDVGVLYNNVGRSYDYAEFLDAVDDKVVSEIIDLNVVAATQMTRLVLPGMVKKRAGAVVNIGSAASVLECGNPMYSVYSASKAYVDALSRSLYYELKGKGVHVQCQIPFFVATKMARIRRATLTVPSADTFAESSLNAIGSGAFVVPYWPHAVQYWLYRSLPTWLVATVAMKTHLSIRKRALEKRARDHKDN